MESLLVALVYLAPLLAICVNLLACEICEEDE